MEVINGFQNINNKINCIVITLDVESFYASISSNLYENAILLARNYVAISDDTINIIMQSRTIPLL